MQYEPCDWSGPGQAEEVGPCDGPVLRVRINETAEEWWACKAHHNLVITEWYPQVNERSK